MSDVILEGQSDNEEILMAEKISEYGKSFIENAQDIILVIDRSGRILFANKTAVETYGYSYKEFLTLSIFDLRNQNVREFTGEQLNLALQSGIKFRTYHYKKDGSGFPVEVKSIYSDIRFKDAVISIIRDITDIEEICRHATMFSTSLDVFDDSFLVFTKENNISHWSSGAAKKFGFKKEEIVGKKIYELIPKDRMDEFHKKMEYIKEGNILRNYETIRLNRYGKEITVSISASPIYDADGLFCGSIAIYKDITDKKELYKKLQVSEERWRIALEGGQFGVWDWDIANNKFFYSNLFKGMLGYNENELSESFEEWKGLVHQEDLPAILDNINGHFKGKHYVVEYRMKCKDNSYKWLRSKGRVISWSKDGKPLRMIGTNEDISDRKVIEEELREKYKQLELLKQEADSANKAKSLFLANMSHEIRTPLNGVLATMQLLQSTALDAEQTKYIKMIMESGNILSATINDLLDISKIETGTFKLNGELFDLKEVVTNIHNNLSIASNQKGLEVRYFFDPTIDVQFIGDKLRLQQILNNLINNAVKFTDDGYVSFRIKKIFSDDQNEKIEFKIEDSGIGIEEDCKEMIFNNFYQGDLSPSKRYMGAGLGLAISKQLAMLMGGDIWFESVVGQGSTFYFTCEFKKSININSDNEKVYINVNHNSANEQFSNKVILAVEDNIINQQVMEDIIMKRGYKYIAAYNGNEALSIVKNNRVDLILMDIQLPELNGFEVTKAIREGGTENKHVPIIAMTAYAMIEDKKKCLQAGMDEYITKPFDIEELYRLIEQYLK
jgi:PAS domain S-box-containing protein